MISTPPVLGALENESIDFFSETAIAFRAPVMLRSIDKDSSARLQLARKAFARGLTPLPIAHKDATWKYKEMGSFRDQTAKELGFKVLVQTNHHGIKNGIEPFSMGASEHTRIMKTTPLRSGLGERGFGAAIRKSSGGGERIRAKESILSVREAWHPWDPRAKGPKLWQTYSPRQAPDRAIRVFPIPNWTQLSMLGYIIQENNKVSSFYFKKERRIVLRVNQMTMFDEERCPIFVSQTPEMRRVTFRKLGCDPLTTGADPDATNVKQMVKEVTELKLSGLTTKLIEGANEDPMEKKKSEGCF